jgi:hypothetical protein
LRHLVEDERALHLRREHGGHGRRRLLPDARALPVDHAGRMDHAVDRAEPRPGGGNERRHAAAIGDVDRLVEDLGAEPAERLDQPDPLGRLIVGRERRPLRLRRQRAPPG